MIETDNLALWNSVQETDPRHTKVFNRGGGFRGTSTNAVYLARKATSLWGPIGIGWGVEIVEEEIIDGAPLEPGVPERIHKVRVRLWYMQGDKRGEVYQFGQTTFVGKNKNGLFTDEEAPKKSLTDGMTKCLSLLGFSADIFMGLYDDNKYVNDLKRKYADDAPDDKPAPDRNARIAKIKAALAEAPGTAKLCEWEQAALAQFADDKPAMATIRTTACVHLHRLILAEVGSMGMATCKYWLKWVPNRKYNDMDNSTLMKALCARIEELEGQEAGA